jgi:hypothetical protein
MFSVSQAKKVLNAPHGDPAMVQWLQYWVENFVRGHSYPPQLLSGSFGELLPSYFGTEKAESVLAGLRSEYHRTVPTNGTPLADDGLEWLPHLIRSDMAAVSLLPPQYLD